MEIAINSALKAQMATMSEADRDLLLSKLHRLSQEFPQMEGVSRIRGEEGLWTLRVTNGLRVLFQVNDSGIMIVAIVRPNQMSPYRRRGMV